MSIIRRLAIKRLFLTILVAFPALVFLTGFAFCQNTAEERDLSGFVTGTVVELNIHTKSISVQDEDNIVHAFTVDDETYFNVVDSLGEISVGDNVTIDYYASGSQELTDQITVNESAHYQVYGDWDAVKENRNIPPYNTIFEEEP